MNDDRRPFSETHPHLQEFSAFLPELNKESDRGRVLIAGSFVDELLRRTLSAYLVEGSVGKELVDGSRAPLGTWSARAAAAFSLGLISDREFKECTGLRKIRNLFAHSITASFDDQAIKTICANLTYAAASYDDVVVDARGQFTTTVVSLILNLTNRPHYVAKQRRSFGEWRN